MTNANNNSGRGIVVLALLIVACLVTMALAMCGSPAARAGAERDPRQVCRALPDGEWDTWVFPTVADALEYIAENPGSFLMWPAGGEPRPCPPIDAPTATATSTATSTATPRPTATSTATPRPIATATPGGRDFPTPGPTITPVPFPTPEPCPAEYVQVTIDLRGALHVVNSTALAWDIELAVVLSDAWHNEVVPVLVHVEPRQHLVVMDVFTKWLPMGFWSADMLIGRPGQGQCSQALSGGGGYRVIFPWMVLNANPYPTR